MRITESRLRRIIRSVIEENMDMGNSVYPFNIVYDGDLDKVNSFNALCVRLASVAGAIIDETYEYRSRFKDYERFSPEFIELALSMFQVEGLSEEREKAVKKAFLALMNESKKDENFIGRIGELEIEYAYYIEEDPQGKALMKLVKSYCTEDLGFFKSASASQRSMEKIKYFRENRLWWDKNRNKPPEDQARADFYMMYLGFDEIKDTQEKFYSDWKKKEEFLDVIIGVDGFYDKDFADFLKTKYN